MMGIRHDRREDGDITPAYRDDASRASVHCINCQHYRSRGDLCKVGATHTNPVSGIVRLITECKEKNANADCSDFLERNLDAESRRELMILAKVALVFALLFAFIFIVESIKQL